MSSRGYYCLIQYCPNRSRLETINLGVLLFCPELKFLGTKLLQENERAKTLLGGDDKTIDSEKNALLDRLDLQHDRLQTVQDLIHFCDTRANDMIITKPRPIKIEDPNTELLSLFLELVQIK